MRLPLTTPALAVALALPAATHGVGRSPIRRAPTVPTISTLNYLRSYAAGDTVQVCRGNPADITVTGHLVDLSTGVEVRTGSGAATSALNVFAGDRQGGDNSNIIIEVATGPATPLGTYQVRLRYLVETNGPDRFFVRVYDRGEIDNLSIVEPPEPSGVYLSGKNYTLRASGQQVDNAALFVAKTGIPGLSIPTVTPTGVSSSAAKSIPIRFANGGSFTIDATDFLDGHLSPAPPVDCTDQCYTGKPRCTFRSSPSRSCRRCRRTHRRPDRRCRSRGRRSRRPE
jgi:hypothetical protein